MKKYLFGLLLLGISGVGWSAVTTDNIKYSNSTSITCTFGSLTNSATVGRSCASVDNSSNLYVDAFVTVIATTGAGTQANDKSIYVYVYGSEDGTNYDEEESLSPSSDASYTINAPTIFKGPVQIPVLTASKQYNRTFSIAQFFGGVMPKKWGLIIVNYTGQTLAGGVITYTGITYTNQ